MFTSKSFGKEKRYGITRNLLIRYLSIREKLNVHYNKNNKHKFNDNYNNEKFTSNLISSQDKIELQNLDTPQYMEVYDQCNNLLRDFEIEFNKLKEEQQKRIVPTFNENESKLIDQNIQYISSKMAQKLQKCRLLAKELKTLLVNSSLDDNIKINMYQNLLNRLAETSRSLQFNEEHYQRKFNEFSGEDSSFANNIINTTNTNVINYDSIETLQTQNFYSNFNSEKKVDIKKERNKELEQMVITVNELKKIFEDASNMVIFQGTILDRIDYNTYEARNNIRRGNTEMEETHERLKSGCLRRVNQILIFAIFIMCILIIFKFF
jgi:t-SNARE complex subunit (syntaxin)